MKTAWVFPGQGSQSVGMGLDLLDVPAAKIKFAQAERILGWSVTEHCQQEASLSRTLYTQPCLYVVSAILSDLMKAEGYQPDFVAGHSLGEYAALYAAGVFSFETGVWLVKERAELMDQISTGAMVALIGADRVQLQTELRQLSNVVLANDNHPGQVVISGLPDAIDTLLTRIKYRRAVSLNVSGAFHSPIVAPASAAFTKILKPVQFASAQVPVISNVEPTPETDASILKARLIHQMTSPVRWREISLRLEREGVERAIEIGAGSVLTGLIERTCENLVLENVDRWDSVSIDAHSSAELAV